MAIVAVVALSWGGCVYQAERALQAEIDAVRATGYPMSVEELRDYYPQPEGEHAGVVYERAFAAIVEPDDSLRPMLPIVGDADLPPRGEPWPEEWLDAAEAHLGANDEALALLREAAAMGPGWFDVPFEEFMGDMPWLGQLRGAVRLMQLKALWQARRGKTDAALEAVATLWRMNDALADEPVLLSHLVRVSMKSAAAEATERLVRKAALSEGQIARLRTLAAEAHDGERGIVRALAGERAMTHLVFEGIARGWGHDGPLLRAVTLHQRDNMEFLKFMAWAIEQVQSEPRRPMSDEEERERLDDLPFYAMLTSILTPAMAAAVNTDLAAEARLTVLDVGLATARFERERGELPESLNELVPTYIDVIPADPFDGQAVKYRRTQTGAIVYSIGEQRTDDSGRELDDRGRRSMGRGDSRTDITFTLGDAQRDLWPEQWEWEWELPER